MKNGLSVDTGCADSIVLVKILRPKNQQSQWYKFQSKSYSEAREDPCSGSKTIREKEFFLTQCYSIQAFDRWDEAHPHKGGQPALFSLFIHT